VLDALAPHLANGRIGAIGASNWMPARLDAAAHWARANQRTGFVASQCAFSLARRSPQSPPFAGCLDVDDAFLEWHRRGGFPLAAYTPQANGFFAKHAGADPAPVAGDAWRWAGNLPRLRRARDLAKRYAVPINRIALAYVLDQTFPTAAIVGARTVEQLEDSWATLDLRLEAQDIAWLEGEEI
nr:aldo/keto reductase [Planctomycetota bacterium]